MSNSTYLLESYNHASRRVAVFEDDGTSAWLYLSDEHDRKPIADVWVHNRIDAPPRSDIKNFRGVPPPAAIGFADDSDICLDPVAHEWTFTWREDGSAVVLHCDGTPVAMLHASHRSGWSRQLKRDGPWGYAWDEGRCNAVLREGE